MLELYIQTLHTDEAGLETPAATRERLKSSFPAGAARRMTQLGMLVGTCLRPLSPETQDTIVYLSQFGESRSLEAYLDSFPCASPTLFQTSIHTGGLQQMLIGRQSAIGTVFPLSGDAQLVSEGLVTAMTAESPRVIICGGEERGTWLTEHNAAAEQSFAFALAATQERGDTCIGTLRINEGDVNAPGLTLLDWFRLLNTRTPYLGPAGAGWNLDLEWH